MFLIFELILLNSFLLKKQNLKEKKNRKEKFKLSLKKQFKKKVF